jgi:hypothetical protein
MNTMNMPGFTADASFYRSSAHYQVRAMLPGLRQGGEVLIHPALPLRCNIFGDCCFTFFGVTCCCFSDDGSCICL